MNQTAAVMKWFSETSVCDPVEILIKLFSKLQLTEKKYETAAVVPWSCAKGKKKTDQEKRKDDDQDPPAISLAY